jgi:beta-glucosidase-like glycosyl hydrolase
MKLEHLIGRLFVVPAHGRFLNASGGEYRELVRHVRVNHVGGVIWFLSNVFEAAWLNARLQELATAPLLVSADLESGLGMRFPDVTLWPPAMAIAATGEPALAEEQGRITAREAQLVGIQQVLAPVADVNVDADNPVINIRSFGEDPHQVARYVAAFIRGVQSEGALATAKHFPGHGDTHIDSHRTLPTLHVDRARLEQVELVPFRAAIEAGVGSIMIGHLAVPSLDPTPALPASVSPAIVNGLLRGELGYDGLVVTDSFDMGGLAAHFDAGEAAVRAIDAGNDQVLYSTDTDAAIAAVTAAVQSGRLTRARIEQSYERIHRVARVRGASLEDIFRGVDAPEHIAIAEEIARKAITRVRDREGLLPLRGSPVAVVVSDWTEENQLVDAVRDLAPRALHTLDSRSHESDAGAIDGEVIVLLLALRPRSGAGRIYVPPAARRLAERAGRKTIAISFGSPYILHAIPDVSTYICAYGIQPVLQRAAVRAVRGTVAMTGRLPVTL